MWPNALDMHTLHIEHALLLGAFTVLTTVNSLVHRGGRGARWFPVYTFAAFLGAVLISLRGNVSDTLSMFLGALLFPVAYVFLHLSLSEFFGQRARGWQLQLLFVSTSAATLLRWGILSPNTSVRVALYSTLLALQLGCTTVYVLRNAVRSEGPVRWAGSMMAGLLALLSINNMVRAESLVVYGGPANYLQGGRQLSWALLITSVLQGAATIAFVWMTAARLQHELRLEATTDPLTAPAQPSRHRHLGRTRDSPEPGSRLAALRHPHRPRRVQEHQRRLGPPLWRHRSARGGARSLQLTQARGSDCSPWRG